MIPSRAQLKVDCRVPPGLGREAVQRAIREVLGPEDGFRVSFDEQVEGNGSPIGSRLREAINSWISSQDPAGSTVPLILPGFTDSRHFRAAFPDCVAYGFFPQMHQSRFDTAPLIHSADERIDVRDLGFAATFYRDVVRELLR